VAAFAAMGWVLDLDGVLWLGDEAIPGATDAVARLRRAGHDVLFCTNNSSQPVTEVEDKLGRFGIPAEGAVVTSALAAASLVDPGERVLVCAGPGVAEAVIRRGAVPVDDGEAEVVMVGFHLGFDYGRLRAAFAAVRSGARFVATNDDRTYPTPSGPIPGGGAIVAAVSYATAVDPIVAGKPHEPMAALVRSRLGPGGTMVGDRADTDGRFAAALGYRFALVLSGVTTEAELPVDPEPEVTAADLAALVQEEVP
jgi:HAD superfamily hydrolase (TIGR01450 family)